MKGNLGFRVIFSVIFLAVFGVYSMKHFSSGWFSEDVASWGPAGGLKPEEVQAIDMSQDVAAAQEQQPEPEEPSPEPTEEPANGLPQVDLTSWELMLVNTENTLDESYEPPEIVKLSDSQCPVDSRIADALTAFAEALVVDSCFFLVVVLLSVLSEVFSPSVVLTVGTEGSAVVLTTGAVIGATVRLMSVVTC